MLDTQELTAAVAELDIRLPYKARDAVRYRERAGETARLQGEWAAWLKDEYLPFASAEGAAAVYRYAWEQGHASGYGEVESVYRDLADIVATALK